MTIQGRKRRGGASLLKNMTTEIHAIAFFKQWLMLMHFETTTWWKCCDGASGRTRLLYHHKRGTCPRLETDVLKQLNIVLLEQIQKKYGLSSWSTWIAWAVIWLTCCFDSSGTATGQPKATNKSEYTLYHRGRDDSSFSGWQSVCEKGMNHFFCNEEDWMARILSE